MTDNHRRSREVRKAREKGVLDALHEVEKAAIPVPDDPPIVYPSALKWRQLSEPGTARPMCDRVAR